MQQMKGGVVTLLLAIPFFLSSGCGESTPEKNEVPPLVEVDGSEHDNDPVPHAEPYTADELRAILKNFRWADTVELREEASNGTPKFYYVEMLVPTYEDTLELDDLAMTWDYLPLFEEEFPADIEDTDVIDIPEIKEGRLVFAILPGEIYNIIRAEALAGTPSYPFVRLRKVPSPYRLSDGSLDPSVL